MPELQVRNPFDGALIDRVPLLDDAGLADRIGRAHAAFAQTRRQPPHERAELLLRVAATIERCRDELAGLIVAEAGKPIALAEAEVTRAAITFSDAASEARRWPGEMLDASAYAPGAGHVALNKRFPIGVVYGLTPFNFPLNLVAHKVAPAIACGTSIVVKPSPRTPLSALRLAHLIHECGAIAGQVEVAIVPNELAQRPLDDDRVRVVSFTGSPAIGWQIRQAARRQRVTLELGGNAPVIVPDDADLESAVPLIATGAFAYAGQSCISVQRILIHTSIYPLVRDALVAHTRRHVLTGDPRRREVIVGPMITPEARQRVLELIESARQSGARLLTGGSPEGPCVTPTLIEAAPPDHPVCAEEAFAPLAVLSTYDDFDDALRQANRSRYGLQAGVFTRDIGRVFKAFHALDVGAVMINQVPTFRLDHLPYGGVKDSGAGREGVRWAIEEMTEPRCLVIRQA